MCSQTEKNNNNNNKKTSTLLTIKQYRENVSLMKDPVLCGFYVSHLIPIVENDLSYTAISRELIGKNVHATIPKGNMGYDQ